MPVITPDDVYNFCGVKSDVQRKQKRSISDIIDRKTIELEEILGRKIQSTTFTNILFQHGVNCEIYDQKLYLKGTYRDLYSITSISEEGTTLSVITDYNDGNDYYFDINTGIIHRKDRNWSQQPYAIKMSGKLGLVNTTTELIRNDVKDVLIEMVAAKSGLWKTNVKTEGGDITTVRMNMSDDSSKMIEKLKIKGV